MEIKKIKDDYTIIIFHDDYIIDDLTETRKMNLELLAYKAIEKLTNNKKL